MSQEDELMKNSLELTELGEKIDELNHTLVRGQRVGVTFWLGIVKGFGAAIGATILFAIVISVVARVFSDVPAVQKALDTANLDGFVEE